MSVAVVPEKSSDRNRSEYTWYGGVVFSLMADRDIRNPTELFRRVEALGGYPRRLSPATIINAFKGVQGVPFELHQYITVILDQAKPLTTEQREELEDSFAWGQKHVPGSGYERENVERAHEFVREMRRRRDTGKEDDPTGG